MFRIKNKKLITRLTIQNMRANKARNRIAVLAVVLTTLLFTGLFSIVASVNASFQQATFRQVGGYFHASVKDISIEQLEELKDDKAVKRAGSRLMLGLAGDAPLNKSQVEVSYMDDVCADDYFCVPIEGGLPKEGTKQLATDTQVLKLLGVKLELGAVVPLTYTLENGEEKTEEFELSGWWEHDPASVACMIVVPESYCKEVLKNQAQSQDNASGVWTLEIMFNNSFAIEEKLEQLLHAHGYQDTDAGKENYVNTGINWAYTSTQLLNDWDISTIVGIVSMLLLILMVGYLIIYNIFRISVTGDIQFYGLLKTIGTTKKQIKKMIFVQSWYLSAIGIPIGLLAGFFLGNVLTPMIMHTQNYKNSVVFVHPLIFVVSVLFSLITVRISCLKPARIAGKVSAVEAVSYTEAGKKTKRLKRGRRGAKLPKMALSNIGRSKSKTVLVVLSLVLSALIFNITLVVANGFDMDKYIARFRNTDYIIGRAEYFQMGNIPSSGDFAIEEGVMEKLKEQTGVTESGRIYGDMDDTKAWFEEEKIYDYYESMGWFDEEYIKYILDEENGDGKGNYTDNIYLYGMDALPLSYLHVVDGDISKVNSTDENYIIEVLMDDDYGNVIEESGACEVGDTITLMYGERYEWYDVRDGGEIDENTPNKYIEQRDGDYWEVTYTVCARVTVPNSISYRRYGYMSYILGSSNYIRDTKTENTMLYLMDVEDNAENRMDSFLENYTTQVNPLYNYESKSKYQKEFMQFRNVFLTIGGVLTLIVGLIGVLNFFNAIYTGIHTRKREFAVMQSVGMTGGQLKKMLVYEGILYTVFSFIIAVLLCFTVEPFVLQAISETYWFFEGRVTLIPLFILLPAFLLIGIFVPLILYRNIAKSSVVERLRTAES